MFPALARSIATKALEELVCLFIADELLLDRVELHVTVEILRYAAEHEYLRKRC
jgi:hypothetical protein